MKRKFKRIASLVLAAVMVFAMAMPGMAVSAAGDYTITIEDTNPKHQYKGYQIFTGTLSKGDGAANPSGQVLSDVSWGDGISSEGITALYEKYYPDGASDPNAKDNIYELLKVLQTKTAEEIVELISTYRQSGRDFHENVGVSYTLEGLEAGYYMVVDEKLPDGSGLEAGDAYSSYIVQVVGDTEMTPKKAPAPDVDKQVQEDTGDATKDTSAGHDGDDDWGETADHEIGETFNFKLKATIQKNADFAAYDSYELIFHDTMSKGLTYGDIKSVKVFINGADGVAYTITDSCKVDNSTDDAGITTLTVTIKDLIALLTGGEFGKQKIEVVVEYSAHLNENAVVAPDSNDNEVYLEYSNNPEVGGTGETLPDTVFVFTYEIPSVKYDKQLNNSTPEMAEAVFELYKSTKDGGADTKINFASAIDKKGVTYYYPAEGGTAELHPDAMSGKFDIRGLDEGYYLLKETTPPTGYNTCDDVLIWINVTKHEEDGNGTNAKAEFKLQREEGTTWSDMTENVIIEQEGATLPETGGIGTTIFYVVGSVLVLGAVILLVTKRRMKSE